MEENHFLSGNIAAERSIEHSAPNNLFLQKILCFAETAAVKLPAVCKNMLDSRPHKSSVECTTGVVGKIVTEL